MQLLLLFPSSGLRESRKFCVWENDGTIRTVTVYGARPIVLPFLYSICTFNCTVECFWGRDNCVSFGFSVCNAMEIVANRVDDERDEEGMDVLNIDKVQKIHWFLENT